MTSPRTRRGRIVRLAVDPAAPEPLREQIYAAPRRDIASGLLPAGARLPSTRALAGDLRVARSTVVQAYEQLRLEGYLEGRPGAGTRVAERLPDEYVRSVRAATPAADLQVTESVSHQSSVVSDNRRSRPGASPGAIRAIATDDRVPTTADSVTWSPPGYTVAAASSAVVGSMIRRTSRIVSAGNPPRRACSRMMRSFGAR